MTDSTQGANGSVFISYSRKDKAFVQKLNAALDCAGVQAWVDWEGIEVASDWMATITNAIQGTDAFLFVISPDSLKSKVCTDELGLGLKLNKKLIPVLYREPEKGMTMHEKLAATNWVYLRQEDNFDDTLPKLIASINTDLDWVRQHTQVLGRAIEWEKKNKDGSFLLNGVELEDAERWMAAAASGKDNRQVLPLQAEYINASRKAASRRQRLLLSGVSFALVLSIVLSIFALLARNQAVIARNDAKAAQAVAQTNEALAVQQQHTAVAAQAIAEENQKIAEEKKKEAEEKTNLANAAKSAAQSQDYQSRAVDLDISTLLAIDSYQRLNSFEAEDLIRVNASRMAMPVKQMSQSGWISHIEWSPDYNYFVTSNRVNYADPASVGQACVWRASDGEKAYCVQHENSVNDAIFTRDGKYLITASSDKTVRFWDAVSGKEIQEKRLRFRDAALDLDVSPSMLAVGRKDNFLTIYYLNSPGLKPADYPQTSSVWAVKFSPGGELLAFVLTNGDVKFWNAKNPTFYNGPKHPLEGYFALAFSPDGNWLVSGGSDSFVRVTKRDGTAKYAVQHGDWVEDVAFGPDPSWYVTVSDDKKVRVLDTATGREKLHMAHANYAQRVQVSPDGQWIASTGTDHMARIWDVASGDEMLQIPLEASGSAISFNQDGTRIIVGEREGHISIWNISSLASRLGYIVFPEYAHQARLTPSGKYLIVNTDDYKIWKIPAESLTQIKDGTKGEVIFTAKSLTYNTAISPDSKWVAAVEYDDDSQRDRGVLISLEGGTQFSLLHGGEVKGVAFDQDSKFVMTAGVNGFVTFWDVNTGEKQFELNNSEAVNSLASSPAGGLLAAGLHNRTRLWNSSTRQPVADLTQMGDIISVVFSQDGKWLATGSNKSLVVLWKAQGMSFEQAGAPLNLKGVPQVLAFSPNGKWLVGGSTENFANIWEVAAGQEIARIPHGDRVNGVSFSPDGSQLFTVSRKMVRIWDIAGIRPVPRDRLIDAACSHLVTNLSRDEWKNLFGSETYRLLCPDLPEGK